MPAGPAGTPSGGLPGPGVHAQPVGVPTYDIFADIVSSIITRAAPVQAMGGDDPDDPDSSDSDSDMDDKDYDEDDVEDKDNSSEFDMVFIDNEPKLVPTMQVYVKVPNMNTIVVPLHGLNSVFFVKEQVKQKTGIPRRHQIMVVDGETMEDSRTVDS